MKNYMDGPIDETLKRLEEAIDHQKNQMHNLQSQSINFGALPQIFSGLLKAQGGALSHTLEHVRELAQSVWQKAQKDIHEKPWEVLSHVAIGSFTIGLLLHKLRHKTRETNR